LGVVRGWMPADGGQPMEGGGIEHDGPDGGVPQEIQDEIRRSAAGGLHRGGDEAGGLEGDEGPGIRAPVLLGWVCRSRRWKLKGSDAKTLIKNLKRILHL
jgi:hypothetical protein